MVAAGKTSGVVLQLSCDLFSWFVSLFAAIVLLEMLILIYVKVYGTLFFLIDRVAFCWVV